MSDLSTALLFVIVAVLLVLGLQWRSARRHAFSLFQRYGIPGPEPELISGNLYHLTKSKVPIHEVIGSWIKKYGNVFGYYLGKSPYIVVRDLDMLKQILIKDFHVFTNRPSELYLKFEPIDKTMLALRDERWKEVRTILTPTFSTAKMKLMMGTVEQKVDILVEIVNGHCEKDNNFDIYDAFKDLTLDVIASCAIALKTRCQQDKNDDFRNMIRNAINAVHNPVIELSLMFPLVEEAFVKVNKYFSITGKMLAGLVDNMNNVIAERQREPSTGRKDVLQLMIDHNKDGKDDSNRLTDIEIIANVLVFLIAGFETTSTALGYTFYALVKYPHIQEKLYKEIQNAEDSSYNTITSLKYLDQVFNEVLRMYPPVTGFITRYTSQDHKVGDFTFPKGAHVIVPVWDLHHDPDLWPEPERFDPDRFHPDNAGSINSMAYMPFGAGPRYCIGTRFAMMEAKLAIFKLVKFFRFEMCSQTEDPISTVNNNMFSINPDKGVFVRVIKRGSV